MRVAVCLSLLLVALAYSQHCEQHGNTMQCMDIMESIHASAHDTFPTAPQSATASAPPTFSPRVQQLLQTMSLREKIGQMTQLDVSTLLNQTSLAAGQVSLNKTALAYGVRTYGVGSYLNSPFAGGPIGDLSGFNVTQWISFMTELKTLAQQYSNSSLPIIYGLDSVHGANYVYGAAIFPHNTGLAATFNTNNAYEGSGRISARDTRAAGISWAFTPVLGIGVMPLWSRTYETFGEDPYLASRMGEAAIKGVEGNAGDLNSQDHCASCMKHYAGYPDPKSGKDRTVAWMGQRQFFRYFLPSFADAVNANSRTLMINSGSINNIPVHSSREILTTVLRDQLGFQGVAVTDYQDIEKLVTSHHLVTTYKEAAEIAIAAGIDMSMVPLDFSFPEDVYNLVKEGRISEARIELSAGRILQLKEDLGLFGDNYLPDPNNPNIALVGSKSDWNLAAKVARESITLLKNSNNLLPLDPSASQRILVTGPAGNSISVQSGGWSIHWQGAKDKEFPTGVTIFDAVQKMASSAHVTFNQGVTFDDVIDIQSVVNDAQNADVIILCLGEAPEAEGEGDINDLTLSAPQLQLYDALEALNVPIVLALVEARPRIINQAANADAIFMCYLPGPMGGEAFADLLFGQTSPSGKLPITYPQYTGSIGVTYYHLYSDVTAPLYEFGHGLSYTTFKYSAIEFPSGDTWNLMKKPNFPVKVTVTNTGKTAADEIILLYVSDQYCTVSPEVKMLRRFERVTLAPGASVTKSFDLHVDDLSFINRGLRTAVEAGTFLVSVGDQSKQFTLQLPR